jgi:hypothetical protein
LPANFPAGTPWMRSVHLLRQATDAISGTIAPLGGRAPPEPCASLCYAQHRRPAPCADAREPLLPMDRSWLGPHEGAVPAAGRTGSARPPGVPAPLWSPPQPLLPRGQGSLLSSNRPWPWRPPCSVRSAPRRKMTIFTVLPLVH